MPLQTSGLYTTTAFLLLSHAAMAAEGPPKPRITLSPLAIDEGQPTEVDLNATLADGSTIDAALYDFAWSAPGATFVNGTAAGDSTPTILATGDAPLAVELVLTPVDGSAPGKGQTELGIKLDQAFLFGQTRKWHPLELWFAGPYSEMTASPINPFLDRRLDVQFTRPDGSQFSVPGFFDGNGYGGPDGKAWKARLTPDAAGIWSFEVSFRGGAGVAVADDPLAGSPLFLDGHSGSFNVAPRDPAAPGFLSDGRLADVGRHYRKQVDGDYWIKSGTNSPENLLGFAGFAAVEKVPGSKGVLHDYAPHEDDWTLDDPELPLAGDWGADASVSRNLFGALNYLESVGVNSVYFLPMNLGGDGQDAYPFLTNQDTDYDKTHYHIPRLHQWEAVFRHAQEKGIQLHFVLAETETANMNWLDLGQLGTQRKLFFREMVARFAHHNGIKWTLSEESKFGPELHTEMAAYLANLDAYDHAIAVHNRPFDEGTLYGPLLGNTDFHATSIQYIPAAAGQTVELWRDLSAAANQPWVIDLDENNPADIGAGPDNAPYLRREVLYDVYFSGGQIEWYLGDYALPVGGDLSVEDLRTREEIWLATGRARVLLESMPFYRMEPMDGLIAGEPGDYGGAEVFAAPGEVYAIYLPVAETTQPIQLDLSADSGPFELSWFDPRTGNTVGATVMLEAGSWVDLPTSPAPTTEDWVAVVRRPSLWIDKAQISLAAGEGATLEIDGSPALGGHLFAFMASLSGTSPGISSNGLTIPLVADAFFGACLASTSLTGLTPPFGILDEDGRATISLSVPSSTSTTMAGTTVWYVWAVGQVAPSLSFPVAVSDPVSVTLMP